MPKTLLTVATRKGTFLLESDDRRDWTLRGPYCEGWPVYHAIYDASSGSIYAAAASEWHGSAVWRSRDLGETWELSSEGLSYGDDDGRKVSKVSTLARAGDRLLVGVEAPGIFESRDNGETWSLLSTLSGQHGSEAWDDPANQPPGHLGISGFVTDPDDSDSFFAVVQGIGAFETEDGGSSWTPRNNGPAPRLARRLRGGRLLRPQARPLVRPAADVPAEPRRHAPLRRRRPVVERDHRGPAGRLRLRRGRPSARHARRSTSSRSTAATAGRCTRARRRSGARATAARAGRTCAKACRRRTRTSASCARG